jgi:hypothetical protein
VCKTSKAIIAKQSAINAQIKKLQAESARLNQKHAAVKKVESGEHPSPAQAALIKSQPFSYGVHFLRAKVLKKVKSPGAVMVSTRLFTTKKEAHQHGKRFSKIHGHKDYSVVLVNKRANAWVNWKTGKTNPVI